MLVLNIKNDISEIAQLAPFVDKLADAYGISPDVLFQLNLALDEALANSVNYAYPEGTTGMVVLEVDAEDNMLVLRLMDYGTPFDPTLKGDVDTTLSVEQRPIGGLGIFLIKQMMDEVTYKREENMNILTMKKQIK